MSSVQETALSSAIGKNLGVIIGLTLFAFFSNMTWGIWEEEPGKVYGWFRGFISGGSIVGNYVFSFFRDDVILKDTSHSGAYNFCWWIGCVWTSLLVFFNMLGLILNIKALRSL